MKNEHSKKQLTNISRLLILPLLLIFCLSLPFLSVGNSKIKTFADGRKYLDIRDFGAVGDGLTDSSSAIQDTLDAAAKLNALVYIPGGLFRMKKGVKVPKGVAVEGNLAATTGPWQDWLDTKDKGGPAVFGSSAGALWGSATYMRGSWILADNGVNEVNSSPTFLLDGNTSISKIGFVNRNLTPVTSMPNHSPPHIAVYTEEISQNANKGITIDNISLANSYIGIAIAQKGSGILKEDTGSTNDKSNPGPVTISNIMGSPMYKGIIIKGISTKVEMSNLQFNYATYISDYVTMRHRQATDVEIMGSENVSITNMLTFGAHCGLAVSPAFKHRVSGLKAINLNLEGQIPIKILASGNFEIENSYFFMVNFAEKVTDKEFRGIKIRKDSQVSSKSTYKFENIMVQNPVIFSETGNSKWEDIAFDIELGANSSAVFTNTQVYGFDQSGQEPQISYKRQSGGTASLIFKNLNFISSPNLQTPLIKISGQGSKSKEVQFINSRFHTKLALPADTVISYKDCTIYSQSTNIYKND